MGARTASGPATTGPPRLSGYIFGQLAQFRGVFARAMFWSVVFVVVPMQVPMLVGMLVNGLVGQPASFYGILTFVDPTTTFWFAIVGLVLVAAGYGVSAFLQATTSQELGRIFAREQRKQLAKALNHSPLDLHHRHGSGELLSRVITDADSTRTFVTQVFFTTVQNALKVAYPVVLLVFLDPWVALSAAALLPVQWEVSRRLQAKLLVANRVARTSKGRLTQVVKEQLDGIETIQSSRAEETSFGLVAREADQLAADQIAVRRYTGLINGTTWALTSLGVAVAWAIGGFQVLNGTLTVGALIAVTGYVVLLDRPMQQFTTVVSAYQQGVVAFERIREVLDAPSDLRDDPRLPPLRVTAGRIEARGVGFGYDSRRLFSNVSFDLLPGRLTAVVGGNGTGKSTVLKLIARLYDPTEGQILIDGQDLRKVRLLTVRDRISVVPQEPVIFTGTITENIRFGRAEASDQDVERAARDSGSLEFVRSLPGGFSTRVGAGGRQLSGGEAQRLVIARALLRNPRILLLDEPNSALDDESEARLLGVLAGLKGRMTIVVVAHHLDRLATVADEVVALDRDGLVDRTRRIGPRAFPVPLLRPSIVVGGV